MKSFRDIALPLIRRGIPVVPVEPGGKRCLLPEWPGRASAVESMVEFWHGECPDYNVGCVAQPDGIVILDCDVKGLDKRIVQETGQQFPETLIVRSAGKGYPWRIWLAYQRDTPMLDRMTDVATFDSRG
jgi:hypothetical protein